MLTTLDFAQKIAARRLVSSNFSVPLADNIFRNSTLETQAEDEHEKAMTHSLIIAHQCTVDALEKYSRTKKISSYRPKRMTIPLP
jgi:hypothetical protein